MRTPSPPWCRLDLAPPLADRFIFGVAPIDYSPVLLLMPFGFHLTMDTLPSGDPQVDGSRSTLACFQLSLSCPFRLLHTLHLLRPARHYPRVQIWRSSFERQRDFNPPEQCAAQRTLWASPTACRTAAAVMSSRRALVARAPIRRPSQAPRLLFPRALSPTTPEGPAGACLLLPR